MSYRGSVAMLDSWSSPALALCALLTVACGSRTSLDLIASAASRASTDAGASIDSGTSSKVPDAGLAFPSGTFGSCAEGFLGPNGNVFLDSAGIEDGAFLIVARNDDAITTTFTDQNGVTSTLTFDSTTDRSALLSGGGVVGGFAGLCVQGPGNEGSFGATVTLTSGALTYDADTMFVSVDGQITGGDGSPCGSTTSPASVWIVCGDGPGGSGAGGESDATGFPVGAYNCTTQLGTYLEVNGIKDYATSGGNGTLSVTAHGETLTATYTGDSSLSGTLDFGVTSPTTANVLPGQSVSAPCTVPISVTGPAPSDASEPIAVASASILVDDGTLFLSFRGSATASCTGALAMGSLICTR